MSSNDKTDKELEDVDKDEQEEVDRLRKEKGELKKNAKHPDPKIQKQVVNDQERELKELESDIQELGDANNRIKKEGVELMNALESVIRDYEKNKEKELLQQAKRLITKMMQEDGITEENQEELTQMLDEGVRLAQKIAQEKKQIAKEAVHLSKDEIVEGKELKRLVKILREQHKLTEIGEKEGKEQHNLKLAKAHEELEHLEGKESKQLRKAIKDRNKTLEILAEILEELEREAEYLKNELEALISEDLGLEKILDVTGHNKKKSNNIQKKAEEIEQNIKVLENKVNQLRKELK